MRRKFSTTILCFLAQIMMNLAEIFQHYLKCRSSELLSIDLKWHAFTETHALLSRKCFYARSPPLVDTYICVTTHKAVTF